MNSTWTFENQSIFPVLALLYKSSSKLKITLLDFLPIQHNSVQQTVNRSMQANDIQSMYFLCIRPQITTCLSVCPSVCLSVCLSRSGGRCPIAHFSTIPTGGTEAYLLLGWTLCQVVQFQTLADVSVLWPRYLTEKVTPKNYIVFNLIKTLHEV